MTNRRRRNRGKKEGSQISRLFLLSHDPATDRIEVRVGKPTATPHLWIARAHLRGLTDHLHDFADHLDREDRNA